MARSIEEKREWQRNYQQRMKDRLAAGLPVPYSVTPEYKAIIKKRKQDNDPTLPFSYSRQYRRENRIKHLANKAAGRPYSKSAITELTEDQKRRYKPAWKATQKRRQHITQYRQSIRRELEITAKDSDYSLKMMRMLRSEGAGDEYYSAIERRLRDEGAK